MFSKVDNLKLIPRSEYFLHILFSSRAFHLVKIISSRSVPTFFLISFSPYLRSRPFRWRSSPILFITSIVYEVTNYNQRSRFIHNGAGVQKKEEYVLAGEDDGIDE